MLFRSFNLLIYSNYYYYLNTDQVDLFYSSLGKINRGSIPYCVYVEMIYRVYKITVLGEKRDFKNGTKGIYLYARVDYFTFLCINAL